MFRLISLLIGYLIGSIQFAYIICKVVGKIDIRDFGSGNSGSTNVTRVLGTKVGIVVFVLDILKGITGFILCSIIFKGTGTFYSSAESTLGLLPGLYAGLGVILGHNFPFYLKFKGGKGSASGLGIILSTNIYIALISYFFGIIIVLLTRYISLASLIVTLTFTISLLIFKLPFEVFLIGLILVLLSTFQHRENIKRIINKTENKFTFKPKNTITK